MLIRFGYPGKIEEARKAMSLELTLFNMENGIMNLYFHKFSLLVS